MTSSRRPAIAIIGGGPRGVSLLERIGASVDAFPAADGLDVHIVDDTEIGAGRIWRTDQTRELCMNTLAGAVTLFTDESATVAGPILPGPTQYEWCQLVRHRAFGDAPEIVSAIPEAHIAAFDRVATRPGVADDYRAELVAQRPESHPSRALYGEYIRWCYAHAVAALPDRVHVHEYRGRVVAAAERDGVQLLHLRAADGTADEISADAVVAATGWLERTPTTEEELLAAAIDADPSLVWVRPGSPVEQPLELIPDGAAAIVRGLGMGFFDAMALVTIGRGGRFVEDPSAAHGLRYEPSGREPVLHVTSHRGVPFRAKTLYGSLPPRAPQRHLRAVDWASEERPIDFDAVAWPRILRDAFADYHETLARVRPGSVELDGALAAIDDLPVSPARAASFLADTMAIIAALDAAVSPFVADPSDRLDLAAAIFPGQSTTWDSPAAFDEWVMRFTAHDLAESAAGHDSALKAALWTISSARGFMHRVGTFGGFDAESRGTGYRTLLSVGGMAGSGPPAFRNRQLLALADAGLVHFIGPAAHVSVRDGVFHASSAAVAGSEVSARVLVDAWMHFHDVAESADPLVRSLDAAGRVRAFSAPAQGGRGGVPTGGFDIDPATSRLVHRDGSIDAAFHVAGIPVEETIHDVVISPMPRTDPTMLRETDRVARSLLAVASASASAAVPSAEAAPTSV